MFPVLGGKLKKCPRDKTQRAAGAQRRRHAFLRTQVARMAKAKQRFTPDADGCLSHNGLSIGSPGLMGPPHSVGTASSSHSVAFIGMVAHQATPLHIPWGCISRSRKREERGSWGALRCDHHCKLCSCSQTPDQNPSHGHAKSWGKPLPGREVPS